MTSHCNLTAYVPEWSSGFQLFAANFEKQAAGNGLLARHRHSNQTLIFVMLLATRPLCETSPNASKWAETAVCCRIPLPFPRRPAPSHSHLPGTSTPRLRRQSLEQGHPDSNDMFALLGGHNGYLNNFSNMKSSCLSGIPSCSSCQNHIWR